MSINSNRRFLRAAALGLLAAWATPAQARWWIFGKSLGRPEMLRVFVAGIDAGKAEGRLEFYREHLSEGHLLIQGYFRPAAGSVVAQARVSVDGGKSWDDKVDLAKDSFLYQFAPAAEDVYDLRVAVTDTKGKESDPGDLPKIAFVYHDTSARQAAEAGLAELAARYAARDFHGFSNLIASDYKGDSGSLEDAVVRDFAQFREIKLSVIPRQTEINGPDAKIHFRYDEAVYLSANSSVNQFSGEATYTLRLEGGRFKLLVMPNPAIFGVSVPSSENPNAGGGTTSPGSGGSTPGGGGGPPPAPGVTSGSGFVGDTLPFNFATGQNAAGGDVGAGCNGFVAFAPAGIQSLGSTPMASVSQAPAGGYASTSSAVRGNTYAVQTRSGKYALLQVTATTGSNCPGFSVNFDYLYQTNGSRTFH